MARALQGHPVPAGHRGPPAGRPAVVCPSQITAEELARWCRVDAEVFVAPHGVDAERFPADEAAPGPTPYALGGRRPARGRTALPGVRRDPRAPQGRPHPGPCLRSLADRHPEALLVLAGGDGWGAGAAIRPSPQSGPPAGVRTGYVADAVIPALPPLRRAAVYPALYEGFGLPALEALSCGTPLITTSGTAMEEVAGDAATLVVPGDRDGLAEALDAVLGSGGATGAERQRRRSISPPPTPGRRVRVNMSRPIAMPGGPGRSRPRGSQPVPPAEPVG